MTNVSSFLSWHSFIVPTADWFVGMHDFELCQGNEWITSAKVPLFPKSEGTLNIPDCAVRAEDAASQDLAELFVHTNGSIWVDDSMCVAHLIGKDEDYIIRALSSAHNTLNSRRPINRVRSKEQDACCVICGRQSSDSASWFTSYKPVRQGTGDFPVVIYAYIYDTIT